MSMWSWFRGEHRAKAVTDGAKADAVLAELLRQQHGADSAMATASAAVEQSAGLWSRAFASASVEPITVRTRALTPSVLAFIGRGLALRGEAVFVIEVTPDAGVRLLPVAAFDVLRGHRYRVDVPMPHRTSTRVLPPEAVVHVRYAVTPEAPWRGRSPLAFMPNTADLAARVDASLSQEYKGPAGTVIFGSENSLGITDAEMQALVTDLRKGGMVAFGQHDRRLNLQNTDPETQLDRQTGEYFNNDEGWLPPNSSPVSDRIGPNPPSVVAELRTGVGADVLGAFGIPPSLYAANSASAREAWRQFLYATIAPVARLVAEELADKLNTAGLRFGFSDLQASDVTGRARAFRSLVDAGLGLEEARRVAGI